MAPPASLTCVAHRIWVGPHQNFVDHNVGLVCLCAHQLQGDYEAYGGKVVVKSPLTDDAFEIVKGDIERSDAAAVQVVDFLRDNPRRDAVFTCVSGQNRSSWVAAKVLMLLRGWSAERAIARLEENRDFKNWFFKQELRGEYP